MLLAKAVGFTKQTNSMNPDLIPKMQSQFDGLAQQHIDWKL